jgi:cytochrome c-type biogenesis protein CcmH/NrfG
VSAPGTAVVSWRPAHESVRMNAIFFASTFLMLLLAMSFASMPLIRHARSSSNGFAYVPLLAVLAALLLAIGLYAAIGRPDIATSGSVHKPSTTVAQESRTEDERKAASVTELLAGLEQRLRENPGDAKAWLLLAKSYDHVGRHEDAVAAYQRAVELGISDDVLEARLR